MFDGLLLWVDFCYVLRRVLSKAVESGFTFYTHLEIEFFLLKDLLIDGRESQLIDTGGYFDMISHDSVYDFRRVAVSALEGFGILVEFSHHEVVLG